MTAEPDLLPCPFCGRQVFLHHGQNGIGFVTCGQRDDGSDGCGAITSFRPNKGGKTAITAWNRRATAARDAEIEALRAEVDRWKIAGREWLDKTEWVQQTIKPRELGRHRADILRERIQQAEANTERLAEALRDARHAGALLSNIAYNLAQDDRLPESTRWSLDDARKKWDALLRDSESASA